jgi:DNA gyrase subunit B
LVQRGHIYIAQPPLYKVKRSKQEQYVKDDEALEAYLVQMALDGASLQTQSDAPLIQGVGLEKLVMEYRTVSALMQRLSRRYPAAVLEMLMHMPVLKVEQLGIHAVVEPWIALLQSKLDPLSKNGVNYTVVAKIETERQLFIPTVQLEFHGNLVEYAFGQDFFHSADYQHIVALGEKLNGLLSDSALIKREDRQQAVQTFKQAYDWLIEEAKRGQTIQRYKGLGEMNPDQLWETTMDPTTRRMLQVKIEDAIAADQIFTTLMGDQVEPRRAFIEANALQVANLDV